MRAKFVVMSSVIRGTVFCAASKAREVSRGRFCLPMPKSRPSFAPVFKTGTPDNGIPDAQWQRWMVRFLACVVVTYLAWLAVVEMLRLPFPWDLFVWPE